MYRKLLAAVSSLAIVFALTGCVGAVDLQTAVLSPDDVEQTIVVHELGTDGITANQVAQFQNAGWQVGETSEKNGVAITLLRKGNAAALRNGTIFRTGTTGGLVDGSPEVSYTVEDGILDRSYHLRIFVPASSSAQPVPVTWRISLPGQITGSNAERLDGDTAVFTFVLGDSNPARSLVVESHEAKDPLPLLGGVLVVGLLFGGVLLKTTRNATARQGSERAPVTKATTTAPASVGCPKCTTSNPSDSRFCRSCGAELVTRLSERQCQKCGATVANDAQFCQSCGHEVPAR